MFVFEFEFEFEFEDDDDDDDNDDDDDQNPIFPIIGVYKITLKILCTCVHWHDQNLINNAHWLCELSKQFVKGNQFMLHKRTTCTQSNGKTLHGLECRRH